ncbi:ATP-binding protein [Candidatus Saccharibacteria bacterium]|nr:ATP-binding protein [Candidatus Saccharibacteria bacterium]
MDHSAFTPHPLIPRPTYLEQLKGFPDRDLIKVVTGLRRSGKSTLFLLFQDYLRAQGVGDNQIITINLDSPLNDFASAKDLYQHIAARLVPGVTTYVFLDEVQMVPDFQVAVNGLRALPDVDVYITGSNAYLLSGELATLLSGRYIEIHMLPLSFREYLSGLYPDAPSLDVLRRKVNLAEIFMDYLEYGGLPQTLNYYSEADGVRLPDDTRIHEYLENIISTIVYKDVMARHNVTDKALLERIIKFILDNIGQPVSIKKIVDTLNGASGGSRVSFYTVEGYVRALEECFLIYRADRYDVRGRELLSTGFKYFVADAGLRNYLLGRSGSQDIGQLLENAVFLELLRRRKAPQVGKYDNLEVDFVTRKGTELAYYQVSKDVNTEATFAREVKPYLAIRDNFPKYLLTLEPGVHGALDGIIHKNIIDWLLEV